MNYIILGSGAIGSLYGAFLSKKFDTLLIGRKDNVDILNKSGIRLTGKKDETIKIKADTSIEKIKPNTVILLTTKSYDSEKSIQEIKSKLLPDTIIISLQNGYGTEEIIKKIVKNKVLRGITNYGITYVKPGEIKVAYVGYTKLENSEISRQISKEFNECGLQTEISKDIQKDVWTKLLINCTFNPLTGILDISNDKLPQVKTCMKNILDEIKLVLDKEGIIIPKEEYDKVLTDYFSTNISSTLQDLRKGKRTEIDYINGAVVKLGKKHKIAAPINEMLVEMIHLREKIAIEKEKKND